MRSPLLKLSPWRAWLLAAALLLAQAAGLLHRHTPLPAGPAESAGALASAPVEPAAPADSPWAHDHRSDSPDCRLIDQLAHADALCGDPVASLPPLVLADTESAPASALLRAAAPALYLARAPPRG